MKYATHNRKIRQLDRLVQTMKQAMIDRKPKSFVEQLRLKIAVLLRELAGILNRRQLATKLGALAVLFGLSTASYAQTFSTPVANPFSFPCDSTSYAGGICTADIDNDGDMDIFMGGYYGTIDFIENTGDVNNPTLAAKVSNPFGLTGAYYYAFLTTIDLDDDGDFDLLAGEYYGQLRYYENTGTVTNPAFAAAQINPFGLSSTYQFSMPEFVDIDDDGDFDLIVGEYYGSFQFFENTGTASSPAFAAATPNPFGLTAAYGFGYPTIADLDLDGDLDMIAGSFYGNMLYYENTGTVSSPSFAAPSTNPFGITAGVSDVVLPQLVDIDGDGDYDILGSAYYGAIIFYENTEFNLGIDHNANDFAVAPNPVRDVLSWSADIDVQSLEVYSVSGQLMLSVSDPGTSADLSGLSAGIYVVKMVDASGRPAQTRVEKL